ncbi:MAG: peptidyl-tRNA hydrolase Pth2 [Candidatus Hodarchaeota archaeon]
MCRRSTLKSANLHSEKFEFKQVLVIRTDLKMSRGKMAVQAAHAAVSAAEEARKHQPAAWRQWLWEGQKKVAVKVSDESALIALRAKAEKAGLPLQLIRDHGLTELPPGTTTVLGIGPARTDSIDKLTRDLPLL